MKNRPADIYIAPPPASSLNREEVYQLILNHLEDPFLLIDKDLNILFASFSTKEKTRQNLGIDLRIGMSVLDMTPEGQHEGLKAVYREVFNGVERKIETEHIREGKTLVFEHYLKPARNEQGEIMGAVISSHDITENRNREKALRELEERWRFALEGAKQGVWDWNLQTGEVFHSDSYNRLYGFEENQIEDIHGWKQRIHPADRDKIETAIREHLESSNPYHETTYRIKTGKGHYIWVLARGMIISRDDSGKPIRMIGTHTDITAQIETEERVKMSEQQYKNLFETNPLPCWIFDLNSLRFIEVNQAAVDHYGYSKKEFLDSTLALIQPEKTREKQIEQIQKSKHKTQNAVNNWEHQKKNGEIIFVDLRINSIQYQNIEARLVVAHDVTGKVHIENELRQSNERFSYAAKASSEALWEWDVISDEFYISQAYTDILGWKLNNSNKFDEWHDYIHPDDRRETIEGYYAAIEDSSREHWSKEYRYLKLDGTYAVVVDKAVILRDGNGKAVKVIGAMQDVTTQKSTEEKLRLSNDRYRHVILATSDIIWDWDLKTNLVVWSDNYARVMGWELPADKTLPVEFCMQHFHPLDRERIEKSIESVIKNPYQTNWQDEIRYRKKDGSYAFISDRGYVIRDNNNEAIRMVGAMQDITERKQHEQLLSLERLIFEMSTDLEISFKTIVETLLLGIERIHPELITSVMVIKGDYLHTLSAPGIPEEFTKSADGFFAPEESELGKAIRQTIIIKNIDEDPVWKPYKIHSGEFNFKGCWSLPITHRTGSVMGILLVYTLEAKTPTEMEMNSLQRIRNILRILMEHNWSLNEIRVANERFDIMMKATHDLIWDWNLETNMIYRDEAGLKKVYGVELNSSIADLRNWLLRIHPEDLGRVHKVISEIMQAKDQDTFDVEYRFRKDDGSYSNVYDRGMIIRNSEGKPIRMIGAAQDITDRKRLEQELLLNELERQKAINQATVDSQEQERSEIGKELHDNVNQVLTTTKLYLDLALSNPELKDELIQKSTKNIISVINEIRQLSRSLMDPSIGDLGLIDSINDLIDNINLTRKLHVTLYAEPKLESLLNKTHKLTIFRIIQEALNNAIRHAKATTVLIYFKTSKKMIEVTIQDDGIGFHPAQVKKGAGLKNIQNRIYLINGTHSIYTAPEKGCKLVINFPIT